MRQKLILNLIPTEKLRLPSMLLIFAEFEQRKKQKAVGGGSLLPETQKDMLLLYPEAEV